MLIPRHAAPTGLGSRRATVAPIVRANVAPAVRRRRGWPRRRGRGGAVLYVFVASILCPFHIKITIPTPPGVPILVRGPTQATRGLANRQAAPRVGVPAPTIALARTLAIAVALAASSSRCRRSSSELVFFLCRTGARRDPRPQDQKEGAPHRRGRGLKSCRAAWAASPSGDTTVRAL